MTEAEIREALDSYRKALRDIQNALDIIKMLEERSTANGSLAPKEVQVISSLPLSARFEMAIEEKLDLELIVTQEIRRLEDIKQDVINLISKASNLRGRIILTEFYLNGATNKDIAERLHYSDVRVVCRIKNKAIKSIKRSL